MPVTIDQPIQNRLLAALPADEYELLRANLQRLWSSVLFYMCVSPQTVQVQVGYADAPIKSLRNRIPRSLHQEALGTQ
jgi:hypothetical protein